MFDLQRTLELVKGMIVEPRPTWEAYYPDSGDLQRTLGLLTIPLIVAAGLLTWVLSHLFGGYYVFGGGFGLGLVITMMVFWAVGIALFTVIITYLARFFKGEADLAHGLAAVSLAGVPSWIGVVLSTLPGLGWLLQLGLAIYGLVLLYKLIPLYLKVPQSARIGHFIATLVCGMVAGVVLSILLAGPMMGRHGPMEPMMRQSGDLGEGQGGVVGGSASSGVPFGKQAELIEAAEQDRYEAPADGMVSAAQMTTYLGMMRKTAELRGMYGEDMDRLAQSIEAKDGEEPSFKDLGTVFSGVMKMGGMATAEMEVVKSLGGNWAEHSWVKEQLRAARIQKDATPASAHNWSLYQQNEAALQEVDSGL